MQNEPEVSGDESIATLNLDTLMVQEAPLIGSSTICVEGTGASCIYSLEPYDVQIYNKTNEITEANRCT